MNRIAALLTVLCMSFAVHAEQAKVAVAANFYHVAQDLVTIFEVESGHSITLISGSSGKLFAQITHGAPFDVYMSADREFPQKLINAGLTATDTQQSYARGQLVVFSYDQMRDVNVVSTMLNQSGRIALPNTKLAPYGQAALSALQHLGLYERLQHRLVSGESVAQSFQYVLSHHARWGFGGLSQLQHAGASSNMNYWLVPPESYMPLDQGVVLLKTSTDNAAAQAWLAFLFLPSTQRRIKTYGYLIDENE